MCFGNYMAAAQCEELHEDYIFPHFQLILLVHPHNLPLLLWKNYTETKPTFCFEASGSVTKISFKSVFNNCWHGCQRKFFQTGKQWEIIFKAIEVKAMDDFKIKITENKNITSYFMGKTVLLVHDQTNIKKKFLCSKNVSVWR